ncbi:MAG TPA: GtrA family protein [Candidatus Paceibacterota bacterium]|nr:GtrA family protein [Candidatus Paceibacterota bacterium]
MARLFKGSTPSLEYARFLAAGALNTATDFVVLNGLLFFAGSAGRSTLAYILCKAGSFSVAVAQSYFINKLWVFGKKDSSLDVRRQIEEGGRFAAVSIAGLIVNIIVSSAAFKLFAGAGIADVRLRANAGALCGALATVAWNYIGYKLFVFRPLSTTPNK